ncbi:hypothetical protein D3C76_1295830 [compost metagenome]
MTPGSVTSNTELQPMARTCVASRVDAPGSMTIDLVVWNAIFSMKTSRVTFLRTVLAKAERLRQPETSHDSDQAGSRFPS